MKYTLRFCLFLVLSAKTVTAQSTFDKLLFEEAQEAYTNGDYEVTLDKINELEKRNIQGPLLLHLKIMATTSLPSGSLNSERVINLHQDVDYYLIQYDNEDFISQYRDVYEVKKMLETNSDYDTDIHLKKISSQDLVNVFFIPDSLIVLNFAVLFGIIILISYILLRKKNDAGLSLATGLIFLIVLVVHFFIPNVYVVEDCGKVQKNLLLLPHKTASGYSLSLGSHTYLINAASKPIYIENQFQTPYLNPLEIKKLDDSNINFMLYMEKPLAENTPMQEYHPLTNICMD